MLCVQQAMMKVTTCQSTMTMSTSPTMSLPGTEMTGTTSAAQTTPLTLSVTGHHGTEPGPQRTETNPGAGHSGTAE